MQKVLTLAFLLLQGHCQFKDWDSKEGPSDDRSVQTNQLIIETWHRVEQRMTPMASMTSSSDDNWVRGEETTLIDPRSEVLINTQKDLFDLDNQWSIQMLRSIARSLTKTQPRNHQQMIPWVLSSLDHTETLFIKEGTVKKLHHWFLIPRNQTAKLGCIPWIVIYNGLILPF